jgi:hypothetical protein
LHELHGPRFSRVAGQAPLPARLDPISTPINPTLGHAMAGGSDQRRQEHGDQCSQQEEDSTMTTEPKLRPDEYDDYLEGFHAGHDGKDFKAEYGCEPDSLAVKRGHRDGCECRQGEDVCNLTGQTDIIKTPADYEREVGFYGLENENELT